MAPARSGGCYAAQAEPADWALLATKAQQTEATGPWLRVTCGPDTRGVLVLQNGVEHVERIAPWVGATPVVPATVLCGAEAVAPGCVVQQRHRRELLTNVAANPLTALTGQRPRIVARPELRELAVGLVRECIQVANARIPLEDAEQVVASYSRVQPEIGSSMLYDRLAGRPLEHDALNGAVVRSGERLGVPTPHNAAIAALRRVINT